MAAAAAATPLTMDWRSGLYSDWECRLGDQCFRLHRNVLAEGSRGSRFFQAAFNENYEVSSTDLTDLLPPACHEHLEAAIEFMYGHAVDVAQSLRTAVALYKIADVLQIDALLAAALAGLGACEIGDVQCALGLAFDIQLPPGGLDRLIQRARMSDVLLALAEVPSAPQLGSVLKTCGQRAKRTELINDFVSRKRPRLDTLLDRSTLRLIFTGKQMIKFRHAPESGVCTCRVLVVKVSGQGPTIGLSKRDTPICIQGCADGGFANQDGCWGFSLSSGHAFSEGMVLAASNYAGSLTGKVVRMELNVKLGRLRFVCENGDRELATVYDQFSNHTPLSFTASACCPDTEYHILDWV